MQDTVLRTNPGAEADTEVHEYLTTMQQRRRIFPRAALVGVGAGLVAAAFRAALAEADHLRNIIISWSHSLPLMGWLFPIAFAVVGSVVSVFLCLRFAPEAGGSGIPHVEAVLHRFRTLTWRRLLPVKFAAGAAAIGSGLMLGREGPTIQLGASVADAVSEWLRVPAEERRTLIAAGAGAGLAAAFNAPLAGVMFVVEEIRRDFHPIIFGAAFLAAALADIVVRILLGGSADFLIPNYPSPPNLSLPIFAVLGTVAGLLGVLFNRALLGTLEVATRLKSSRMLAAAAAVGVAVGLIGWYSPRLIGSGHALSETALAGGIALASIPLFFGIRFVFTTLSYGTGAAGGVFAPMLAMGSLIGLGIGQLAHNLFPAAVPQPAVFAVVGMAAYFAAIVRAPLTGIVLIVEMTGSYQQILPLLIACFCAYAVSELMKEPALYESMLERDLRHEAAALELREPLVMEFEIEQGAPFASQMIRSLGLPEGCVLVRGIDAGREFIPAASTRLVPHMRVTAFIAPQAAQAVEMLREGCRALERRDTNTHEI